MTVTDTRPDPLDILALLDAPRAWIDSETTHLDPELRRIWNFGGVRRDPGRDDRTIDIIIEDVDLTHANADSLRIGHFYERHPRHGGDPGDALVVGEEEAAHLIHQWLLPLFLDRPLTSPQAHVFGCVPSFDVQTARELLIRYDLAWPGHYHLIDVENMAVGYLMGLGFFHQNEELLLSQRQEMFAELAQGRRPEGDRPLFPMPPYSSDAITAALGLPPVPDHLRHTALGDAMWALDMTDAMVRAGVPASLLGVPAAVV